MLLSYSICLARPVIILVESFSTVTINNADLTAVVE